MTYTHIQAHLQENNVVKRHEKGVERLAQH